MLFTLKWLRDVLETEADIHEIKKVLELIGFEVEAVTDKRAIYAPFVIAAVQKAEPHPSADKLKVCTVFDGAQQLQIVCGASNARAGIRVVLAPVGTKMPVGDLTIKVAKIRDVESTGMLCSAEELGLASASDGIMELPADAPVGHKFAEYAGLDDVVLDIAITPNRGDCLSVYGIARELAAAGLGTLKPVPDPAVTVGSERVVPVRILEPDACSAFALRAVWGVSNGATPAEILHRMQAIGSSDKGALISISNYAMFSYGRPNHIYDAAKITGDVVIRYSQEGEKFIALGGQEYNLPAGLLVVADQAKVLAIAGVIGGELSKVDTNTKDILLEVANFAPDEVAKSGRALNLLSDSRYRFERRVDSGADRWFLNYLTDLVTVYCGGMPAIAQNATGTPLEYTSTIWINRERIRSIIGAEISDSDMDNALQALGFKVEQEVVTVPSWRQGDIATTEDLAEEVLRLYGYHTIQGKPIQYSSNEAQLLPKLNQISLKKEVATVLGIYEVITWSFMHSADLARYDLSSDIVINNPISSELDVMRPSIIPNLVELIVRNIARHQSDFGIFEYGPIYGSHFNGHQNDCLAGARVGEANRRSVHKDNHIYNFFDVKGDVLAIIKMFGLNSNAIQLIPAAPPYYHPGQSATFNLGNKVLAYAGVLHPKIKDHYGIVDSVVMFEVFPEMMPLSRERSSFGAALSDLQSVSRDFAFTVKQDLTAAELLKAVQGIRNPIISKVAIFDVYQGIGVEQGYKSIGFNVLMQPQDETMTEQQIEAISAQVIAAVQQIGGSLR